MIQHIILTTSVIIFPTKNDDFSNKKWWRLSKSLQVKRIKQYAHIGLTQTEPLELCFISCLEIVTKFSF